MAYEALLIGTVTTDETVSDGTLSARATGGDSWLDFDLEAVAGAASQLDPTIGPGVVAQAIEIVLSGSIGGQPFEVIDHADTEAGIEVERSLTDKTTWSLRAPASSEMWEPWALGYEVAFGGAPPPGLARISVAARYGVGENQFSIPLVTGGLATSSRRPIGRGGHGITLSGFGPESRYDRLKVTLQLEAGHGLTHGEIIAAAAEYVGVPAESIGVDASFGFPLSRALDAIEEDFWPFITEVALGAGGVPLWTEDDRLIARQRAPVSGSPRHRITAGRILGGDISNGVEIEGNAEVVTCIRILGTSPVIPSNDAEGSTLEVTVNKTYVMGFAPREALFTQQSDGTLDPLVGSAGSFLPTGAFFFDPEGRTLKAMTITVKEKRGGCLISEDVLNLGWRVQESARYQFIEPAQNDGERDWISQVYLFEAGAAANDSSPAYLQTRESWVLISRERKDYEYGGGDDGMELSTVRTRTGAYFNEENAAKTPGAPAPYDWPAENYIADQFILGGGKVVKNLFETFRGAGEGFDYLVPYVGYVGEPGINPAGLANPLTDALTTYTGRGGYLVREETATLGYALQQGTGYWFEGDRVSSSLFEAFGPTESVVTTYNASPGDTTHKVVKTTANAITRESVSEVSDGEGYLPTIPRCDPTDNARKEGEPFQAERCSGLQWRLPNLQEVRNEFVESFDRADALAFVLLREAQGIPVDVSIPFDATIKPGDTVLLDLPDLHIQHRGWVDSHKLAVNGRFRYSELSLRLHPA